MRFTVLMPTHARPDVIGFAIESVLAQSEPDFELLVVGDGVADETRAAVARFSDPRVRWFDLPKAPGFGYANRNTALREARGELLAMASDDDLMLPDHLERMGAALAEPRAKLVYAQTLWVSSDGIAAPDLTDLSHPTERQRFLIKANSLAAGAIGYRRDSFNTLVHWPEQVLSAGDWWMWKDIIARHGMESVRGLREIIHLHFAAPRMGRRDGRSPRLRAWLKRADRGEPWPAALRIPPKPGEPPQAAYAEALRTDPTWPAAVREGARDLVNRLALEALQRIEFFDRPRHIVRRWLGKA
jgi:glycosyltransferase involved in cell wall biosynthesis